MSDEDAMTPEDYRRRYFELKTNAKSYRGGSGKTANPETLPAQIVLSDETIPGGWYWTARIPRGQTLRIVNSEGGAGVSALLWNADDTSERFNAGDTVKVQWTAQLGEGRMLLSDMGRVLASITADTSGAHDFLVGGSTRGSDTRKYSAPAPRNTRDNFILAAGKLGMEPRDVPPCVTFFAPVRTDDDGHFVWEADRIKAGDYVDLRAEMNLFVALSNCPHPLNPDKSWNPRPVRALLWRSPPAMADDECRTATKEAVRAFENTDALFGKGSS